MTKVYAAGSEDMDTLTFNTPILFRHLTFSEAKKAPISEINLEKVLDGLGMDMSQVATFSILLCWHSIGLLTPIVHRPLHPIGMRLSRTHKRHWPQECTQID